MATITLRGTDVFYRDAGRGAPLLLIHGASGNADVWSPVFEDFARDYRVIAYDRRGHTRTRGTLPRPAGYHRAHAEDAAALLEELAAMPATVVGWSSGALIALHLAVQHPDLVAALVLEEPPYLMQSNPTPDAAAAFAAVGQLAGEGRLREGAESFLRFATAYRTGGNAFDAFGPELRESLLANAGALFAELAATTGEDLTPDDFSRLTGGITCLIGDLSPQIFLDSTSRLAERLPQARVVRISNAAHAMHFDAPQQFAEAVRTAVAASA